MPKDIRYDRKILDELAGPYVLDNIKEGFAHYNVVDWVMLAYPEYAEEIKSAVIAMKDDVDISADGMRSFKKERVTAFLKAWIKPSRDVRRKHAEN